MRISDWSSDVCSSDLCCSPSPTRAHPPTTTTTPRHWQPSASPPSPAPPTSSRTCSPPHWTAVTSRAGPTPTPRRCDQAPGERGGTRQRRAPGPTRLRTIGFVGRGEAMLRSEEHTSELQSLMRSSYAVFCLKKKHKQRHTQLHQI